MEEYILTVVYILAGVLGLCVGSFLNVVIYRLPEGMRLDKPGSHCTACNYSLRWFDNIPVLSYLFLGGKCRKCKTRISIRYPLVELANAIFWLLSAVLFWETGIVYACVAALVSSLLICVFFIDLDRMLIYDRFIVMLGVLGLVAAFFDPSTRVWEHFVGAAVGGGVFAGLYYGCIALLKKEGLGFGDVKLALVTGLLLGWQKFIFAMLITSLSACIVLLAAKWIRKDEKGKEYPFAPFITVGVAAAMFVGAPVIAWYLGLFL